MSSGGGPSKRAPNGEATVADTTSVDRSSSDYSGKGSLDKKAPPPHHEQTISDRNQRGDTARENGLPISLEPPPSYDQAISHTSEFGNLTQRPNNKASDLAAARLDNTSQPQTVLPEINRHIELGGDASIMTIAGNPAILAASVYGDVDAVAALLDAGMSVNEIDSADQTPLMIAAGWGHLPVVKFLVERGAAINATCDQGTHALLRAAKHGYTEIVDYLLRAGAKVNLQDKKGNHALFVAASAGHNKVVQTLLSRGAQVNLQTFEGFQKGYHALYAAAHQGHNEVVQTLLSAGAQVNLQNYGQHRALDAAALRGHSDVVQSLLKYGADTSLRDDTSHNAIFWAAARLHNEIFASLMSSGRANVDVESTTEVALVACFRISEDLCDFLGSSEEIVVAHADALIDLGLVSRAKPLLRSMLGSDSLVRWIDSIQSQRDARAAIVLGRLLLLEGHTERADQMYTNIISSYFRKDLGRMTNLLGSALRKEKVGVLFGAQLIHRHGKVKLIMGDLTNAELLFRKALKEYERVPSKSQAFVCESLYCLAVSLKLQNKSEIAANNLRAARDLAEKSLGSNYLLRQLINKDPSLSHLEKLPNHDEIWKEHIENLLFAKGVILDRFIDQSFKDPSTTDILKYLKRKP